MLSVLPRMLRKSAMASWLDARSSTCSSAVKVDCGKNIADLEGALVPPWIKSAARCFSRASSTSAMNAISARV